MMNTRRSARLTNNSSRKNSTVESEVPLNSSTSPLTNNVQTAPEVLVVKKETSEQLPLVVETLSSGDIMNIELNLDVTDFESVLVSDFYAPASVLPSRAADLNCSIKETTVLTDTQQLCALLEDSDSWIETSRAKDFDNDPSMEMVNPQEILQSSCFELSDDCALIESSAIMSPASYCSSEQNSPVSFEPDSPATFESRSRSASFIVPELVVGDIDEPMQILEDILGLEGDKIVDFEQVGVQFLHDLDEENRENAINEPIARIVTIASSPAEHLSVTPVRRVSTASMMSYPELDDEDLDSLLSGFECTSQEASPPPTQPTPVAIAPKPVAFPALLVTPPLSPISIASTFTAIVPKKSTRGRKRKIQDDADYEVVTKTRKQGSNRKAAQSYRARKKNSEQEAYKQLEEVTAKNDAIRKRLNDAIDKRNLMLEIACGMPHLLDRMPAWVKPWFEERMAKQNE